MKAGWLMLIGGMAAPAGALAAQSVSADASLGLRGRFALSGQWRVLDPGPLSLRAGLRLTRYGGDPGTFHNRGSVTSVLPATVELAPRVWGLNLMIGGDLALAGPLALGANLDLAGIGVGPERGIGSARLEPARGSLFRYGNADRGSLNSELFVSLRVGGRFRIRGGLSHYVVGYRAVETGGTTETRYQRFDTVPFIALAWR